MVITISMKLHLGKDMKLLMGVAIRKLQLMNNCDVVDRG